MANVEKVSVALTQDMAVMVRQAVASGDYASSSEVVRDALRDWKAKRADRDIERLRALLAEGEASGSGPWEGVEAIKAEARRRAGL